MLKVILADDDRDDCFLFREALGELPVSSELDTVFDGDQLMQYLKEHQQKLPDILFLDLNMPKKNGFECLAEIKQDDKLKDLQVVMFSTSYPRDMNYEQDIIKLLYNLGSRDYLRKPSNFSKLKEVIYDILLRLEEEQGLKNTIS